MAFLLNYGQFYERLRDLLENNHPVNKYKFGNKVNGAMKDFDYFLENTVKKYMDAYNATQFIKAENGELRVIIDRLKKEINQLNIEEDFLRLQLEEKDAMCREMIGQRQKMQERFQYNTKDNPLIVEVQRLRVIVDELKQENRALKIEIQVQRSRMESKQKQIAEERTILEQELSNSVLNCQKLQSEYQLKLTKTQNSLQLKLHSETKLLEEQHAEIEALKKEIEALCRKKEEWRRKYYEQVGFVALTEDEENKSLSY